MLLSLSWLRGRFTPYEGTAEALGDSLTMLGLELEDIRRPYESIASLWLGMLLAVRRIPHRIIACLYGGCRTEALLHIVCGAPNIAQGQKVPVLLGTVMPDGMKIKSQTAWCRIRGHDLLRGNWGC